MEPQTKEQLNRKEDLHKEIILNLEVIGLTHTKYKPSTIRTIAQFRKSLPRVKAILKNRKLKKKSFFSLIKGKQKKTKLKLQTL